MVAIVTVIVVAVGADVTINFIFSKEASLKVEPTAVTPLTAVIKTMSSSISPWGLGKVIVTFFEEELLVKSQAAMVVRIG